MSYPNDRRIALSASFSPQAGKAIRSVIVIIDISNTSNGFRFDGGLSPNRWTTRLTTNLVAQNSYDLHEHLGRVNCYVDGITYRDGTGWFGGTPDS